MSAGEIISKNELTHAKVLEVYTQAYMDAELDDDGDIKLELDGYRCFVVVSPEQSVMRVWTAFALTPEPPGERVLQLCNRINLELLIIRAGYAAEPPLLILDHQLVTQAGLTGREIVDATRRFRSILDAILPLDTEKLLP